MDDLISRQEALNMPFSNGINEDGALYVPWREVKDNLEKLPSAQPERSEIIPDTKAVPSNYDCVNLSERVTATFYDDEHEEWSQKTVTIRDVLDSSCDEYTVINSERKKGKWIIHKGACEPDYMECSRCKWITEYYGGLEETWDFCPHCGCDMRQEGEQE